MFLLLLLYTYLPFFWQRLVVSVYLEMLFLSLKLMYHFFLNWFFSAVNNNMLNKL